MDDLKNIGKRNWRCKSQDRGKWGMILENAKEEEGRRRKSVTPSVEKTGNFRHGFN